MVCKPIIEFLLWNDCTAHGKCSFCWQQARHECSKFLDDVEKLNSIHCVKQFLHDNFVRLSDGSDNKYTGNHILLVGGEIFDIKSTSVNEKLRDLIDFIIELMNRDEIELLYINTNLLYEDLTNLKYLLDKIDENNLWERLHFTSSWDLAGRFDTEFKSKLYDKNLKEIRKEYPNAHIIVNSILTKQYCETLVENPNYLKEFQEKYDVMVNVIPYIVLTDWLAPTKNQVVKALLAINSVMPDYVVNYVNNFSLPQPKFLYEYNSVDKSLVYSSSDMSSCGHSENFKNYCIDSKNCYICDIKHLLNKIS